MILLIDNFDSFTFNLVDYLKQLGQECFVIRNDIAPEDLPPISFDGLLLSPGPGKPKEAGFLLEYIDRNVGKVPILGVCLGNQAIGEYFGASVVKAKKPMHGKLSKVQKLVNSQLLASLPNQWEVVRYHSLLLSNLENTPLKVTIETLDGEIMGIQHEQYLIEGIQFHPEAALTEFGIDILKNWVALIKNNNIAMAN